MNRETEKSDSPLGRGGECLPMMSSCHLVLNIKYDILKYGYKGENGDRITEGWTLKVLGI